MEDVLCTARGMRGVARLRKSPITVEPTVFDKSNVPTPSPTGHLVSSGKAILLGEHFVVYGASALAVSVPQAVELTWRTADGPSLWIDNWQLHVAPSADGTELERAFRALFDAAPWATQSIELRATIGIPSGAGLGSSAALGVAVLRALEAASQHTLTQDERFELLFAWEGVFHGQPSGFDHAASLHQGFTRFRRFEQPPLQTLPPAQNLYAVVAHVEPGASTKVMVDGVRAWRESQPIRFQDLMNEAELRVELFLEALARQDMPTAGRLLDANHEALRTIGVSTPALDRAVAFAREAGAYGAKLIGAGGGGCMIALTDARHLDTLQRALDGRTLQTLRVQPNVPSSSLLPPTLE